MNDDPDNALSFRGHPLRTYTVDLAGRRIALIGPAVPEDLLELPPVEQRFNRDGYMPYWADLWPASQLLAQAVAAWPVADPGHADDVEARGATGVPAVTVLELGCGLGLASVVAALRGYAVTASDYDEDSLAFAAENARRADVALAATRWVDWRETYPDLRFHRILAADVLYESRNLRPVAEFIHAHLLPGGFALVADANRSTADPFERIAVHCGLRVATTPCERHDPEAGRVIRGRIFRLARSAPA